MYEYTIRKIENGWLLTVCKPEQVKTTRYFFETRFEAFTELARITIESLKGTAEDSGH